MLVRPCFAILAIMILATACTAPTAEGSAAAKNPNVPGATGNTVVTGSSSSMADSNRVHPNWGAAGVDAQRGD